MNQFEAAKHFYEQAREQILAAPCNEWAVDPYAWTPYIRMTPIEDWLWSDIRDANAVFYPQYPVDRFFVDFANPVAKVAIECDGAAFHQDKAKDAARDKRLAELGWAVYRITGSECRTDYDEETGEIGYGRKFVDAIADYYGLKRDAKPRKVVSGTDLYVPLIEHLLSVNELRA
jgi:very-short-patch-repair endonuclease